MKGRLVWFQLYRGEWHPGIVIDYKPDVLGGSWCQSYWSGSERVNEFMTEPHRGECLVQLFDGAGCGWVDEKNLRSPEEHELSSAQGTS